MTTIALGAENFERTVSTPATADGSSSGIVFGKVDTEAERALSAVATIRVGS